MFEGLEVSHEWLLGFVDLDVDAKFGRLVDGKRLL